MEPLSEINDVNISLLDLIPFEIAIVDEDGTIQHVNNNLRKKVIDTEPIGKKCWEIVKDNGKQCEDCPLRKSIDVGVSGIKEAACLFGGKYYRISHTGVIFKGKKALLKIFQDISEEKYSDRMLIENELRFRTLIQNSFEAILIRDENSKITFASNSVFRITGFEVGELVGTNADDYIHPDDKIIFAENKKLLNDNPDKPIISTYRRLTKSGKYIWCEGAMTNMLHSPSIAGIVVNFRDITLQVESDIALKKSEFFFKESQNVASIGSYQTDFIKGVWESSEVLDRIFGIDEKYDRSVAGWLNIVHPDDILMMNEYLQQEIFAKRQAFSKEYRIVRKSDGAVRWVYGLGKLEFDEAGAVRSMIGTIQDITVRKEADEKLRQGEEKYRLIVENSNDGIWCIDENNITTFANKRFCEMLEYPLEEVIGKPNSFFVDEERKFYSEKAIEERKSLKSGTVELILISKSGKRIWAFLSASPILNPSGGYAGALATVTDITERKENEILLKREKQFQILTNEILTVLNGDAELKEMIDKILTIIQKELGYDAVGIRIKEGNDFPYFAERGFNTKFLKKENSLLSFDDNNFICMDEKGMPKYECTCGLVVSGKTDSKNPMFTESGSFWVNDSLPILEVPEDLDFRFKPRNTCIHFGFRSIAIIPIRTNSNIIGVLQLNDKRKNIFAKDILDFFENICLSIGNALMRKQSELLLREQSKELKKTNEELDRFVYSTSHDLRAPIMSLSGLVNLLENAIPDNDELLEYCSMMKESVVRVDDVIKEILDYSRNARKEVVPEKIDVFKLVTDIIENLRFLNPNKKINFNLDIDDKIHFWSDKYRVNSLINNLITNAVKYQRDEEPNPVVSISFYLMNSQVVFEIEDNGEGIPPERIDKVFDMFYRGSKKSVGSGLGLYISKGIVERLGGSIALQSEEGKGTKFTISIPNFKIDRTEIIQAIEKNEAN